MILLERNEFDAVETCEMLHAVSGEFRHPMLPHGAVQDEVVDACGRDIQIDGGCKSKVNSRPARGKYLNGGICEHAIHVWTKHIGGNRSR